MIGTELADCRGCFTPFQTVNTMATSTCPFGILTSTMFPDLSGRQKRGTTILQDIRVSLNAGHPTGYTLQIQLHVDPNHSVCVCMTNTTINIYQHLSTISEFQSSSWSLSGQASEIWSSFEAAADISLHFCMRDVRARNSGSSSYKRCSANLCSLYLRGKRKGT